MFLDYSWLIPIIPAVSFVLILLFGRRLPRKGSEIGITVMNVDIGGGTSKIAICKDGKVIDLTAVDIGARLVAFDSENRVTRIEAAVLIVVYVAVLPFLR